MLAIVLTCALAACGSSGHAGHTGSSLASESQLASGQTPFLTFRDASGQEIKLDRKPERIVMLNTELLDLLYQAGGAAVGRSTAPGYTPPEAARGVQEVGQINSVNMEEIFNLKPDLVIGQPLFHAKLRTQFQEANIPFSVLTVKSAQDISSNGKLMGQLADKEEAVTASLQRMEEQIKTMIGKLPQGKEPTFAMLTVMGNSPSIQKGSSIALDVAAGLHMKNVAEGLQVGPMGAVPFSMEKLAELNPDYLFWTVHGTEDSGLETIKKQLEGNPAWSSIKPVKEGKFYMLPSRWFVNNPGFELDKSYAYLAQIVYPESFGGKP
ncbi:ABC transporter substrate-binding protein [Paenibacillus filicis]|uniref:ABC transporter substrate-binding protein n=1 Tax=Paenibacillus filicis TaxID=669464 RepID=A0ABU9DV88_9BACL